MYCPKCGIADQSPESFCRNCGIFLYDPSKPFRPEATPEGNLKATIILSTLTIFVSFILAAFFFFFLVFGIGTPALFYMTTAYLLVIGTWQIQTLVRNLRLRDQLQRWHRSGHAPQPELSTAQDQRCLETADLRDDIPASVTEQTTKPLVDRRKP
jgi:hypothetical protein